MASSTLRAYNSGLPRDDHVFVAIKGDPDTQTAQDLCYHVLSAGALTMDYSTLLGPLTCMKNLGELTNATGSITKKRDTAMGYMGKHHLKFNDDVTIAHNALFSNYASLRTMLRQKGYSFRTQSHVEVVLHLLKMVSTSSSDLVSTIRQVCTHLQGSYSMVFLTEDKLVAARDAEGYRPLFIGLKPSTGALVFTSENASLFYVRAHRVGEVAPGYLYVLDNNKNAKPYSKVNAIPIFPSQDDFSCQHLYLNLTTTLYQTNPSPNVSSQLGRKYVFVGIHGDPKASPLCYCAVKQPKEGEAAGAGIITFSDNGVPISITDTLTHAFEVDESTKHEMLGKSAIGYLGNDIHPLIANTPFGSIAIVHNGHLSNYSSLRSMLEEKNYIFNTASHAEVVSYLTSMISTSLTDLIGVIRDVCGHLKGSFSMIFLTENRLVAVRDEEGLRPLVMGLRCSTGAIVFASKTGALDSVEAVYEEDVHPGYLYVVDKFFAKNHMEVKCMALKPDPVLQMSKLKIGCVQAEW